MSRLYDCVFVWRGVREGWERIDSEAPRALAKMLRDDGAEARIGSAAIGAPEGAPGLATTFGVPIPTDDAGRPLPDDPDRFTSGRP